MSVVYVLRFNHAKYLNFTIFYVEILIFIIITKKSQNLSFTPPCETLEPNPASIS